MVVLAGVGTIAFTNLARWNVTKAAKSYDSGLSRAQVLGMSKDNAVITLTKNGDSLEMKISNGTQQDSFRDLGNANRIDVKYEDSAGNTTTLGDGDSLMLSYVRSSGAFLPIITSVDTNGVPTAGSTYCKKIVFSGASKVKTITLYRYTGKHTLD